MRRSSVTVKGQIKSQVVTRDKPRKSEPHSVDKIIIPGTRNRSALDTGLPAPHSVGEADPIPFYAKVKVTSGKGVPAKAVGRTGIVLGRAQLKTGRWTYSVFLGGLNVSYSLPHIALKPTGEILSRNDIYGERGKIRVVVDGRGAGKMIAE